MDFPNLVQLLLEMGEKVSGFKSEDYWLDIGRREDYEIAQHEYQSRARGILMRLIMSIFQRCIGKNMPHPERVIKNLQRLIKAQDWSWHFYRRAMGSKRLPGKALMRIQGQSILERTVRRLRASPVVDEVVVLTTITREDDVIVQETEKLAQWSIVDRNWTCSKDFRKRLNDLIPTSSYGLLATIH